MKNGRISNKESDKLAILYKKYRDRMRMQAYPILKDDALAEDAVHQSFLKIMQYLDRIDMEDDGKTISFLNIVCRNVAKDMYQKLKPESAASDYIEVTELVGEDVSYFTNEPFEKLVQKESLNTLRKTVKLLPLIYQDVLELELFHHYSLKEIAKLLNLRYDTVKKRSERGRKMLGDLLRKEEAFHETAKNHQRI